ncbi:MAG: hypothetical protein F4Y49_14220 [Dehalococcoidia bacterium]|nr:hypothetical protein [Dehalococcoidia bacterium]
MTLENVRTGDDALSILLESKQAKQCFHDNYDQWKAMYPDQWVAVSKDGLVAHHEGLDSVIAGFREKGYTNTQVIVKRLDTKPRAFIL